MSLFRTVINGCVADKCRDNYKLLVDGTCQECETYTHLSENGKYCSSDTCSALQKLLPSGKCEDCDPFTR